MNKSSKILKNATIKLNRGKFRKSIIGFKEYLRLNPDQFETLNKLAHAYNGAGEYEEAIKVSNRVLNLSPHSKDALNNLFYAYDQKEKFDEALKILKKYIDTHSNDLEDSLKSYESYIQFLRKIQFKRIPKKSQFFLRTFKEDYESVSVKHILPLIDPTEVINLNLEVGFRFSKIGWSKKKVDVLELVLEEFPSFQHIRIFLGLEYLNKGMHKKAEVIIEKALEIDPEDLYTWGSRGVLFMKVNEFQKAIDVFEHMLTLRPKPESEKVKKYLENHVTDYYKLKDEHDKKVIWVEIGNNYNKLGEYKKAITACINALKIDSQFMEQILSTTTSTKTDIIGSKAWMNISAAYHGLGYNKKAFKSLKESLKCNSSNSSSWKHLGYLHYETENFKRSIKAYKRVVKLDANDFEGWYNLARSFFKEGKVDDAIKANTHCLNINSQFDQAIEFQKTLNSSK
ncbi:hypothetical protein LCGC14_1211160 [marine sediment metagenome]|uniref:Uncharacterized protein n=1 Tax=marine sediment metagenome TaxID=412755 RepID=A0A0F9LIB6_9ZZZZ